MKEEQSMKMLLVIYNIAVENELFDLLNANGLECFTQWPRVLGKGHSTGPKMDNDVWPGVNASIFTVLPAEKATQMLQAIGKLRDAIGTHEGVKAFILPVEAMTGDY